MDKEIINTRTAKFWKDEDGIIHNVIIQNSEMNLEDAKENIEVLKILGNGVAEYLLSDVRLAKMVSKEAKDYSANAPVINNAILVDSPMTKIMGNLFIRISKPLYNNKIFTDEKEALQWLKELMHKKDS